MALIVMKVQKVHELKKAQPAQNRHKSHIMFYKSNSPSDLYTMTLATTMHFVKPLPLFLNFPAKSLIVYNHAISSQVLTCKEAVITIKIGQLITCSLHSLYTRTVSS